MTSTLLECSSSHIVCEDAFFVKETSEAVWGGIFDGCSSGSKSHWASETFCKLYKACFCLESIVGHIGQMTELQVISDILNLEKLELLSTVILFRYNKNTETLCIRAFGDCNYWLDGVEYRIEQNNTPDYMGYHIGKSNIEKEEYLNKYEVRTYYNIKSFVISSDGTDKLNISQFKEKKLEALEELLQSPTSSNFLQRKWNILKKQGWTVEDDLSIISYTNEKVPIHSE